MSDYERIKREFDLSLLHKKGSCPGVELPVSLEKGGTGATDAAGAAENLKEALVDLIYPVGSIYMSVGGASPTALFGGMWERIEDAFLLAAGSSFAAGSTGGEAAHRLTTAELPAPPHKLGVPHRSVYGGNDSYGGFNNSGTRTISLTSDAAGGDGTHNNMPPYIAVFIWKRTA